MKNFSNTKSRYAALGITSILPREVIDSVWNVIDYDLQGLLPLNNILQFDLLNRNGSLSFHFSQKGGNMEVAIDLPFEFSPNYPPTVFAYDDGEAQIILLPVELSQR